MYSCQALAGSMVLAGKLPSGLASFLPAQPGPGLSWAPTLHYVCSRSLGAQAPTSGPRLSQGSCCGARLVLQTGCEQQTAKAKQINIPDPCVFPDPFPPCPQCPASPSAPPPLSPRAGVWISQKPQKRGPVSQKHCSTFPAGLLQAFSERDNLNS